MKTDLEKLRDEALFATFTEGPTTLLDITLRPISLGSLTVMERLNLDLLLSPGLAFEAALTDATELRRQCGAFVWLHSAPIDDVLQAVRSFDEGQLEELFTPFALSASIIVPSILAELKRVADQIAAAAVTVRAKPGERSEEPDDLVEPGGTAVTVFSIAMNTGWSEQSILWELPIGRMLQYYHCALRKNRAITVLRTVAARDDGQIKSDVLTLRTMAAQLTAADQSDDD